MKCMQLELLEKIKPEDSGVMGLSRTIRGHTYIYSMGAVRVCLCHLRATESSDTWHRRVKHAH